MHILSVQQADSDASFDDPVDLNQEQAEIIIFSRVDSEIFGLSKAIENLSKTSKQVCEIRIAPIAQLAHPFSIDLYVNKTLKMAKLVVVRLLGGESYFCYGINEIQKNCSVNNIAFMAMPGCANRDQELINKSSINHSVVEKVWQAFVQGGGDNYLNLLLFFQDIVALDTVDLSKQRETSPDDGNHQHSDCRAKSYENLPSDFIGRLKIFHYPKFGLYCCRSKEFLPIAPPSENSKGVVARALYDDYDALRSSGGSIGKKMSRNKTSELDANELDANRLQRGKPHVLVLFYRALVQADDVEPLYEVSSRLSKQNLVPICLAVTSLKDEEVYQGIAEFARDYKIVAIANMTVFAVGNQDVVRDGVGLLGLDLPIFQVSLSSLPREMWRKSSYGYHGGDMVMQVFMPEIDGRLQSAPVSFKQLQQVHPYSQSTILRHKTDKKAVELLVAKIKKASYLSSKQNHKKKIALVLSNYPGHGMKIAYGVGLDIQLSLRYILRRLDSDGFDLGGFDGDCDGDCDEIWRRLDFDLNSGTNSGHGSELSADETSSGGQRGGYLSRQDYQSWLDRRPKQFQQMIFEKWGDVEQDSLYEKTAGGFRFCSLKLGNMLLAVQPERFSSSQGSLFKEQNFHDTSCPPCHGYVAFYCYLHRGHKSDAVVQVGTHGTLEWMPGKVTGLSAQCTPSILVGNLPYFYIFIVNDPSEGVCAKRRISACLLDHNIVSMKNHKLYGDFYELEAMMEEYAECQNSDKKRAELLKSRIKELGEFLNIRKSMTTYQHSNTYQYNDVANPDLEQVSRQDQQKKITKQGVQKAGVQKESNKDEVNLQVIDTFLCDLKHYQVKDGLYSFGQKLGQQQLVDTSLMVSRCQFGVDSYLNFVATWLEIHSLEEGFFDFDNLIKQVDDDLAACFCSDGVQKSSIGAKQTKKSSRKSNYKRGDLLLLVEEYAADLLRAQLSNKLQQAENHRQEQLFEVIKSIARVVVPKVELSPIRELDSLMRALKGKFIAPKASGSPSRGRLDVLPTGGNFFSLDYRTMPTRASCELASKSSEIFLQRYVEEHGDWPRSIAMVLWGASNLRTGGDDIAQVLAFIGAEPVYSKENNRVETFRLIEAEKLQRPRIPVLLRVSGFFRDAFQEQISWLSDLFQLLLTNEEPSGVNLFKLFEDQEAGFIFSSQSGSFGGGIKNSVLAGDINTEEIAEQFVSYGSTVLDGYSGSRLDGSKIENRELLKKRLRKVDAILFSQDNKDFDLLEADDYFEFIGGLTKAVASNRDTDCDFDASKRVYYGDNSNLKPRIKSLVQEINLVVYGKAGNPAWVKAMLKHKSRGAFEFAKTVDMLFGFASLTSVVESEHFEHLFKTYLGDEEIRDFIKKQHRPSYDAIIARFNLSKEKGFWRPTSNLFSLFAR